MPTAPPSSPPPRRASSSGAGLFTGRELIFAAALLAYAFILGGALLGGTLAPERAFWFLALPCLAPAVWYGVAYFQQSGERDAGVLLSAAGWFLIALALLFKQIAVTRAGSDAYALQASSPVVPVAAAFGVLCLLLGAVFSWLFWAGQEDEITSRVGEHY